MMCPCGGELTVWCIEHGDWVCDDVAARLRGLDPGSSEEE